MSRLIIAVDSGVDVSASELARSWNDDAEARDHGQATVEPAGGGMLLPELAELVAIPLAVNLASNLLYDLTYRLLADLRTRQKNEPAVSEELEIVEHQSGDDRMVIVRMRREKR